MSNLIEDLGYEKLTAGIRLDELIEATKALECMNEDGQFLGSYAIGMAYLIGIKQGAHDERARRNRKGGSYVFNEL